MQFVSDLPLIHSGILLKTDFRLFLNSSKTIFLNSNSLKTHQLELEFKNTPDKAREIPGRESLHKQERPLSAVYLQRPLLAVYLAPLPCYCLQLSPSTAQ